jgi:hypothetical protein
MLDNGRGRIGSHITYRNIAALRCIKINVVRAGCRDADEFQIFSRLQVIALESDLVADNDRRIFYALPDIFPCGFRVRGPPAQHRPDRFKIKVTPVNSIDIQKYAVHLLL